MSLLRTLRNVAVLVILAVGFFSSAPRAGAKKPEGCYFQHCSPYLGGCPAGYVCSSYLCCCPVKK